MAVCGSARLKRTYGMCLHTPRSAKSKSVYISLSESLLKWEAGQETNVKPCFTREGEEMKIHAACFLNTETIPCRKGISPHGGKVGLEVIGAEKVNDCKWHLN